MLARQLLAGPDCANKIRDGRSADITRCDRDNQCLLRLALGMETTTVIAGANHTKLSQR